MYWLTGMMGLALGGAPFLLGYSDNSAALWTSIGLGVIVTVLSVIEAVDRSGETWEYWVAGAVGLLAVIAPFALGFNTITWAMWVTVGFGFLVVLISAYEIFTEQLTAQ